MSVDSLSPSAWIFLIVGACLVGIAKTALNGIGTLAVVAFVVALPAKESTGALLPLLIVGDVIAVSVYRRHADWPKLLRLLPGVVPGLLIGVWFLSVADDTVVRRCIGAIIIGLCLLQLWGPAPPTTPVSSRRAGAVGGLMGAVAGFVTMTANAAGAVTSLYLVRAGMQMMAMLGTVAWFYFLVNLTKLPLSAAAGLITWSSLLVDLLLVPALAVGALVGVRLVKRLDQALFEKLIVWLSLASGVALLW